MSKVPSLHCVAWSISDTDAPDNEIALADIIVMVQTVVMSPKLIACDLDTAQGDKPGLVSDRQLKKIFR